MMMAADTVEPSIRPVTLDDNGGTYGVDEKTGRIMTIRNSKQDGSGKKYLDRISDCALHIIAETHAHGETEFTFAGVGAVDKRHVKFTLPASECADGRKFKAALINAFGVQNKVLNLKFEIVQDISLNPKVLERIEEPRWSDQGIMIPGADWIRSPVEYKLSPDIPAEVYDGDRKAAAEVLKNLMCVHKYAPLVVAFVMGAPAVAKWHVNNRFGLGLWGLTGTLKTSTVLQILAIFGAGYASEPKLKAGKEAGSTVVGCLETFKAAGILAQLLDNQKSVEERDTKQYVAIINAGLEGGISLISGGKSVKVIIFKEEHQAEFESFAQLVKEKELAQLEKGKELLQNWKISEMERDPDNLLDKKSPDQIRALIYEDMYNLKTHEAGTGWMRLGTLLSFNNTEQILGAGFKALIDQNKIIIKQNELLLKKLDELKNAPPDGAAPEESP